jgi:hypothetical protein
MYITAKAQKLLVNKELNIVHQTRYYYCFNFLEENREQKLNDVNRLAKSILKTGGNVIPVIVDKNLNVIDGQHRIKACESCDLPVKYVVVDTDISYSTLMQEINKTAKPWAIIDYVAHYKSLGVEGYAEFYDLLQKKNIPPTSVITFLRTNSTYIKKGNPIDVTDEVLDNIEKLLLVEKAFRATGSAKYRTNHTAQAIMMLNDAAEGRISRGETIDLDYNKIANSIKHVVGIDGFADSPEAIYRALSRALDYRAKVKYKI